MRLVLVNYEYPPLGGGAGNATRCIAHALALQGHEVVVVTSAFKDLRGEAEEESGVRVTRLAVRRRREDRSDYGEMLSFVFAANAFLRRFLRDYAADGLVVFFSLPCGPLGWLAHRRTGVPYAISLRGGDVPGAEARVGAIHRLLTPLRRAVLRKAKSVIANSSGLARLSEAADPIPVAVIPNGVDTDFFTPVQRREVAAEPVNIMFAGRFQSQKNLFALIEQFAVARKRTTRSLRLTMIGDGPQRADLQRHASALGLDGMIAWLGWLDKHRLREAYTAADIFVNPSLYEGMPNTVLEAMACGLPVIASRVMGNEELVANGETGLLFDLHQPDALTDAMCTLADDAGRRATMGVRAREIACTKYTWHAAAAQYAKLFQRD